MSVVFAARALNDIADIYDYIAARNPVAAQRVEDALRSACLGLADFPFASVSTDEPGIRRLPLVRFPYTIFFRIDRKGRCVEIARIIHASRVRNLGQLPP